MDSLGVDNYFGGANFSGLGTTALIILLMFLFAVVIGVVTFLYYSKKIKKVQYKYQIPIFVNLNGKLTRTGVDNAKELFIPDSNISLFYLKHKKIYIARPTRAMGMNEFWYSISENGEWVNFDLSMNPESNTLASANYDHRDTRYAYVNLKEIIKRNYKDKSSPWWKDPVIMNIIAFVIMSVIFLIGAFILISRIGKFIEQMGPLIEQWKIISESMAQSVQQAQNLNSGIINA